ncbi:hypothetical protein ACU81Q_06350 [Komagataeibacter melomenusus]|nr:hypothetical protein [Komagataeibacter melomenusus]
MKQKPRLYGRGFLLEVFGEALKKAGGTQKLLSGQQDGAASGLA